MADFQENKKPVRDNEAEDIFEDGTVSGGADGGSGSTGKGDSRARESEFPAAESAKDSCPVSCADLSTESDTAENPADSAAESQNIKDSSEPAAASDSGESKEAAAVSDGGEIAEDKDSAEDKEDAEDKDGKEKEPGKKSGFNDLFDCVETFCYALVLMMILFVFVFRFVSVNGTSMTNTLQNNDKLIISDMMYTPATGDIVVLDAGKLFPDRYIIKRVIATGGQKVEMDFADWVVKVDGSTLNESYVNRVPGDMRIENWILTDESVSLGYDDGIPRFASFTVPKGQLFVMGDNRNGSSDSRMVGCFDEDSVLGRVLLRVGPRKSFGRVE